jgi:hypothetical protein
MIRRITTWLIVCSTFLVLTRCKEDEADSPPRTSFTVDKNSGLAFDEDFTFTIDEVGADNITLYPYGKEHAAWGTVAVTSFTNGVATVKFRYSHVGTFDAVVVSNNHTDHGSSANATSDPESITVTSDNAFITAFSLGGVAAEFDGATDNEIELTVPFGTDTLAGKATFTATPFSVVTVGATTQTSGTTTNNFVNDVVYTVTSQDGSESKDYTVKVKVTPVEINPNFKSVTGVLTSTGLDNRAIPAYSSSDDGIIVFYDVLGTPDVNFDSVTVGYTLDGKFSVAKSGNPLKKLAQNQKFNLLTNPRPTVEVWTQDSTNTAPIEYEMYFVDAPTLTLTSNDLNPQPIITRDKFNIGIKVLNTTDVTSMQLISDLTLPPNTTFDKIVVDEVNYSEGDVITVDLSSPQAFDVYVHDNTLNIDYVVTYTVTVTKGF